MKKAALFFFMLFCFPVPLYAQGYVPDVRAISRKGGYQAYRPKAVPKKPLKLEEIEADPMRDTPPEVIAELNKAPNPDGEKPHLRKEKNLNKEKGRNKQASQRNNAQFPQGGGEYQTEDIQKYIENNPHVLSDVR